jgi:hypothetical protein
MIALVEARRDKVKTGGATDDEPGGAATPFAAANVGSSRTSELAAELSMRITTCTTQQSNERTGAASRSALWVRHRITALALELRLRLRRATALS